MFSSSSLGISSAILALSYFITYFSDCKQIYGKTINLPPTLPYEDDDPLAPIRINIPAS